MLLADWAYRLSVVAIVVVPVHIARIEVHVVGVVRITRIERTRPVVAVRTNIVERSAIHVTRCGQLPFYTSVVLFFSRSKECPICSKPTTPSHCYPYSIAGPTTYEFILYVIYLQYLRQLLLDLCQECHSFQRRPLFYWVRNDAMHHIGHPHRCRLFFLQ